MTDLIYDYIAQGVDMLITGAVLAAVVILLRNSATLSAYQADLQANSERVNYYKQYNMYDQTSDLCSADILSAILYYRNDLEIAVLDAGGNIRITNRPNGGSIDGKLWVLNTTDGKWEEQTADEVAEHELLKASSTFSSKLCENGQGANPDGVNYQGGTITGLLFKLNNP